MTPTKRSQNKCKKCGYTWYPRGKSISLKCPGCGSSEVGFAGGGLGVLAAIVLAAVFFGGGKKTAPQTTPAQQNAPSVSGLEESASVGVEVGPAHRADVQGQLTQPAEVENVIEPVATQPAVSECVNNDPSKQSECSGADCQRAALPADCQTKRTPQNELF